MRLKFKNVHRNPRIFNVKKRSVASKWISILLMTKSRTQQTLTPNNVLCPFHTSPWHLLTEISHPVLTISSGCLQSVYVTLFYHRSLTLASDGIPYFCNSVTAVWKFFDSLYDSQDRTAFGKNIFIFCYRPSIIKPKSHLQQSA